MQDTYYIVRQRGRAYRLYNNLDVAEVAAKELMKSGADKVEILEASKKVIWEDGEYVE